jgi:hypothetical protein
MKQIVAAFHGGQIPETFFSVAPDADPGTEIGPFRTLRKANNFAAQRFKGRADILVYSNVHLVKSEEISAEEYAAIMRDPKAHGLLIDPAAI